MLFIGQNWKFNGIINEVKQPRTLNCKTLFKKSSVSVIGKKVKNYFSNKVIQ